MAYDEKMVSHPAHYRRGGLECIDVIEALELPFHLANTMKYIWRAGKKDKERELEDLEKARWYLGRYIMKLENKIESEGRKRNEYSGAVCKDDGSERQGGGN